jgi:UDP-N-acetyl-D-mannosaminuronic acid dehydrogenase
MNHKKKILVIGAGGRVGYPFAGYCQWKGYDTYGYDLNEKAYEIAEAFVEADRPPFDERLFELVTSSGYQKILVDADVIVVMVGTPVDAEGNPRLDGINNLFDHHIIPALRERTKDLLIILRSTVAPGTTELILEKIDTYSASWKPDVHLVFAPERIAQGKTFIEMPMLPQIIGAIDQEAFDLAEEFFSKLSPSCIRLTIRQAELGKLMTNMYRYVNFALANQFMMIADHYGQDFESIRTAINHEYPRMNLEKAGPNAAGPCLFKDGQFLVDHIPYSDIIKTAFSVNEGMPAWIYDTHIKPFNYHMGASVGILGMTFKGNNDDTRYSLSYKLKKLLQRKGINTVCYDPYLPECNDPTTLHRCNIVVMMTPHDIFTQEFMEKYIQPGVLVIDIWKKFPESQNDWLNGVFWTSEG